MRKYGRMLAVGGGGQKSGVVGYGFSKLQKTESPVFSVEVKQFRILAFHSISIIDSRLSRIQLFRLFNGRVS